MFKWLEIWILMFLIFWCWVNCIVCWIVWWKVICFFNFLIKKFLIKWILVFGLDSFVIWILICVVFLFLKYNFLKNVYFFWDKIVWRVYLCNWFFNFFFKVFKLFFVLLIFIIMFGLVVWRVKKIWFIFWLILIFEIFVVWYFFINVFFKNWFWMIKIGYVLGFVNYLELCVFVVFKWKLIGCIFCFICCNKIKLIFLIKNEFYLVFYFFIFFNVFLKCLSWGKFI